MRRATAALGSVFFFTIAPGVVAGLVPWWLTHWEVRGSLPVALRLIGIAIIVAGVLVLVSAFGQFAVEGRGTPAPVAPTERLVVGGLYRYIRNPMYVAVLAIIAGQALTMGRRELLVYGAAVAAAMAAFVRLYEEPILRHRYGAQYERYRQAVPGWRPRLRAWNDPGADSDRR